MPTLRQQRAVQKMVESGGKEKSMGEIMIEAGFSPETAKTPQKLTESDGFKQLMEEYLPDDLLMKVHLEGLGANKVVSARAKTKHGDPINADEDTDDFIEVPDHPTRGKFLELGYKIKGKMSGEAGSITNIIVPIIVSRREDTAESNPAPSEAV